MDDKVKQIVDDDCSKSFVIVKSPNRPSPLSSGGGASASQMLPLAGGLAVGQTHPHTAFDGEGIITPSVIH